MTGDQIRSALEAATSHYAANPDDARSRDSLATAKLRDGLVVHVEAPTGERITTDMVASVGGTGTAPSPGWLLRAAEASCVATLIAMRAATLGITLDTLEVAVDSESDDRGMLGMDDSVPAGPLTGRVQVRLTADGVDPATLDEMARWGVEHCPVCNALERPVPITVEVATNYPSRGRAGMPTTNPLEDVPVLLLFAIFAIITFVAYEIGFQVGRWWQAREPGVQEGPTGVLVGSLLALLAFLLAITMGMASDRFDTRRGLVLDEANAMGTTYLRAGYLPEPASSEIRNLLREYVPLRVAPSDRATLLANIQRSEELLQQMWSVAEAEAKVTQQGDLMSTFIESLNETIDLHESRVAAGVYARVPASVLWLLVIGSVLTLGMVGYSAGLTGRRDLLSAIVLIVALGAVLTLVVDLDRPREGFVQVSQQPIIDLQQQIGPPS